MEREAKVIRPVKRVEGKIVLPGDKSISHRAVMIGAIADGTTNVKNFLNAEDCIATVDAFRKMGVDIRRDNKALVIKGAGLKGFNRPPSALYLGNSGTTMRLLLGILAGQDFESTLTGDESLSRRPMRRVTDPLRQMGAAIRGRDNANFAPLIIHGGKLRAIDYTSPVASAQVKSCILFAGLYAEGETSVIEPFKSRDHTERMLKLFNADISVENLKISKGLVMAEAVMTELAHSGMNRQEAHETLRQNSMTAIEEDKEFLEVLKADKRILKFIPEKNLQDIFDFPQNYLGTAKEQIEVVLLKAEGVINKK